MYFSHWNANASEKRSHNTVHTPFRMTSLLSLHFINKTIFQLVLQFTEFTWTGGKGITEIFNHS